MMTINDAISLAVEAKRDGMLNRFPIACITLAAEVERLKRLCESLGKPDTEGV